ncbi:hypothetical protein COLO4_06602 [Corchorus olitorius]|uniref:CCHC-type domain-containing protein n=1 Tax=Corchorus olitorius TaxID=93759 RepID=A0A1R3KMJ9_9ROSI|nr:hypothetical protein COLO4_06602 [Corchorus olitorius]
MAEDLEIVLETQEEGVREATKFTVIGKILTEKPLNRRGVVGVIQSTWPRKEIVAVREMGSNLYAISFASQKFMEEVLANGPWSVMGCSLNLRKWEIGQVISDLDFSKIDFWIQVHNLPIEMLTFQNAEKIGAVIGTLLYYEDPSWVLGCGVKKGKVRAEIRYEKLSDFCYACGRIGHIVRNCEKDEGILKYGLGLRTGLIWDKKTIRWPGDVIKTNVVSGNLEEVSRTMETDCVTSVGKVVEKGVDDLVACGVSEAGKEVLSNSLVVYDFQKNDMENSKIEEENLCRSLICPDEPRAADLGDNEVPTRDSSYMLQQLTDVVLVADFRKLNLKRALTYLAKE